MKNPNLLATAALLLASPLAAQYRLPPDSVVRAILTEQVDAKHTAGIVVGLLDADGTRRVLAAGRADNDGVTLDGNTVFEIGSITKTFTNALLADMIRRGEVTLDEPVQKLLPTTVKVPTRNGQQITLLDLATASSGLPSLPNNFAPKDRGNPYADYTVQQMYDFLSGYTLTRDIGSKYEYSNLGMGLLGHALALRLGKSYFDALHERVLAPLGMNDTEIELSPALKSRLALGHNPAGQVVPNWDLPTLAGAGALRSTVNDMLKYLAANLDSTSKPLGSTLAMTHGTRRPTTSPQMTIGLAWHILKAPGGGTIVWHNGGTGGYRSFMGFDLAKRAGVVVLTNSAIGADDVGFHLIDSLFPLSKPPAQPKEVAIDPAVLPPYAGVYQLAPTFSLTVTVNDGALWVEPTGQSKIRVFPSSEREFFVKGQDVRVTFVKGDDGQVTGLVLHQAGGDAPAKKVR